MTQFKTLQQVRQEMLRLPQENFWPVGPESGQFLKEKVKIVKPRKVLELGTSSGYSTTWLIEAIQELKPQQPTNLITIESNQARYDLAQKYFSQIDLSHIKLNQIRHHAPEVFDEIDLSNLDFIFCDAIKKQTLDLYQTLRPNMTPGSLFIADNVISHRDSMLDLFTYLEENQIEHKVHDIGAGLIVIPYQ